MHTELPAHVLRQTSKPVQASMRCGAYMLMRSRSLITCAAIHPVFTTGFAHLITTRFSWRSTLSCERRSFGATEAIVPSLLKWLGLFSWEGESQGERADGF